MKILFNEIYTIEINDTSIKKKIKKKILVFKKNNFNKIIVSNEEY